MIVNRSIPESVKEVCPEVELYERLVQQEKKIDHLVNRHKYKLFEELRQSKHVKSNAVLEININTIIQFTQCTESVQDQTLVQFISEKINMPGMVPIINDPTNLEVFWETNIEGKLIFNEGDENSANQKKLSNYFKAMVIEVDRVAYGDQMAIMEWHKEKNCDFDQFKIRRFGLPKDIRLRILIELEHMPPKFRLTQQLADLLGLEVASKTTFVAAIWQYIIDNKLQSIQEPHLIELNEPLRNLLKITVLPISDLVTAFNPHLIKMEPLSIEYTIPRSALENLSIDKHTFAIPVVYKRIEMSTENAYADEIRNWISTLKTRTDLESIDSEIAKVLKCINQTNYSYNFFRSFSQDPISFFKDWLKNQQQSLQTIHQGITDIDNPNNPTDYLKYEDVLADSDYFRKPWVKEAAKKYASDLFNQKTKEIERDLKRN